MAFVGGRFEALAGKDVAKVATALCALDGNPSSIRVGDPRHSALHVVVEGRPPASRVELHTPSSVSGAGYVMRGYVMRVKE